MKPLIGLTSSLLEGKTLSTAQAYIDAVMRAGGVPVVLPNVDDPETVSRICAALDGLLVTGGGDIDPTLFGEEPHPKLGDICPERDQFERMIIKQVLEDDKPLLAICRGCQILNIAIGGDMYQDIYSQIDTPLLQHTQKAPATHASHFIDVERSSHLYVISESDRYKVNSFHHQAVRSIGGGFAVCARSSDGVIEAFESKRHRFAIGVQWHPEHLASKGDAPSLRLFEALIRASGR